MSRNFPSTSLSDSAILDFINSGPDLLSSEDDDEDYNDIASLENISDSEPSDDESVDNNTIVPKWTIYSGPDFDMNPYTLSGGYKAPGFNPPVSTLQFFQLFFSDELITQIVIETNRYAAEKIGKQRPLRKNSLWHTWKAVTLEEMKAFLGVILNMGLNPKPSLQDYFSTDWLYHQPFFSSIFSRARFFQIFWCFHISPPVANPQNRSRGDKVKNVVTYLQSRCMEYFVPLFECSVDESTIAFKGRVIFKVYNNMKPIKWGLKVFVLSDSRSGYIWCFDPYYGKDTTDNLVRPDLLATSRIVMNFAQKLRDKFPSSGFHLFTDRYYTGIDLAAELLKMGIHLTGTINQNRKGLPTGVKKGSLKRKKHERVAYRRDDNILVSAWKDKRNVLMLSTLGNNDTEVVDRKEKRGRVVEVVKPSVIYEYNRYMGGVDQADHYVSSYKFLHKSVKWWRKMFFWLLEVGVVNSYLLYNMNRVNAGEKSIEHRKYREISIKELVGDVRSESTRKPSFELDRAERLNGKQHFMDVNLNKRTRDCAVCSNRKVKGQRKETIYYCKTCSNKPGLCPGGCFEMYHTLRKYK